VVIFITNNNLEGNSPDRCRTVAVKEFNFITFVKFGLILLDSFSKIVLRADNNRAEGLTQLLPREYFQYFCGFFQYP